MSLSVAEAGARTADAGGEGRPDGASQVCVRILCHGLCGHERADTCCKRLYSQRCDLSFCPARSARSVCAPSGFATRRPGLPNQTKCL